MDYPNDREVLETFECDRPVSFKYVPHSDYGRSTDIEGSAMDTKLSRGPTER
jgi:hypothetical protein